MRDLTRTIVAQATPRGVGAIHVVRVSGPRSLEFLERVFSPLVPGKWVPWKLRLGRLRVSVGEIDTALAVYMKAPRSYTGEDLIEIYSHGNQLIVDVLVNTLVEFGAQRALPGEFTERAYLNGKLSLSEAEAVQQVAEAATLVELETAARKLGGEFDKFAHRVAEELLTVLSILEGSTEFADQEIDEIEPELRKADEVVRNLLEELRKEKAAFERRRGAKKRPQIAIVGPVNAGKSSLFNALIGESRAIVSEIPGTTRDTVSEEVLIGGIPMSVRDTAGMRKGSEDPIEKIGIERAEREAREADLLIRVVPVDSQDIVGCLKELPLAERTVDVISKADLAKEKAKNVACKLGAIAVSVMTGIGVRTLLDEIENRVTEVARGRAGRLLLTEREAGIIDAVVPELEAVVSERLVEKEPAMALHHISRAVSYLSSATTRMVGEESVRRLFENFCVGK